MHNTLKGKHIWALRTLSPYMGKMNHRLPIAGLAYSIWSHDWFKAMASTFLKKKKKRRAMASTTGYSIV